MEVNGTLVPFIELGVGFNPELTGRENVYLNGACLASPMTRLRPCMTILWNYAELEEFMDQKLKNYSSGMQVRLAFSVAIKAQGDILVLDEVLASVMRHSSVSAMTTLPRSRKIRTRPLFW